MSGKFRFFTIITIQSSGLGDQLGTQFIRLYGLGKSIGANFLYTPISFPRSVQPIWYKTLQKITFRIRCIFLFVIGQNLLSSVVNIFLTRFERMIEYLTDWSNKDQLSEFLGLNETSEGDLSLLNNAVFFDLNLDELIETKRVTCLKEFFDYINSISIENDAILRLSWSGKLWSFIPVIDNILNQAGDQIKKSGRNVLLKCFRSKHVLPLSDRKSIVFHIRLGDSTTIELISCKLIVYDKYLFSSEKQMQEIYSIDPDRISISPEILLDTYLKFRNPTEIDNKFEFTIISDGYQLTYHNILKNLLKRRCQIKLNIEDKKLLKSKIDQMNNVFENFKGAELIIGEGKSKLYKSILRISNADVVVWGCGGFACNVHNLFNDNYNSKLINNKYINNSAIIDFYNNL